MQAGFARAVGPLPCGAELSENAAHGNEPPRTAQGRERRVEQVIRPKEIRLHDTARLRRAGACSEPRAHCLACVRHDDVEPAPSFDGPIDQSPYVRFVAHVAREVPCLSARVGHLSDGLPEIALLAATHQDACPPPGELESDASPNPFSAARDDGDLSPEKCLGHAAPSSTLTEPSMTTIKRTVKGDADPDEEERRARLRGRRFGLGIVIVVAVVFIGVSSAQIVAAVFGLGTTPLAGPMGTPERQCALGISRLARALDAPGTPWTEADSVENDCRKAAGGLDAWAALLRLQAAQSQLADSSQADLRPLRREVAAHLPADLR